MEIDLKSKTPDIRKLSDMKMVLYDQKWAENAPDTELYYMYRGLEEQGDLRYDITVIPARKLGRELVKTKGHNHIGNYGELYMVLEGEAIYLMQKGDENKITDVCAVKVKKDESVVIPSGYGHVTINPSEKDLKMANWVSKNCKNDFSLFERKRGACYYYTENGWIKNENYKEVPELRFESSLKGIPQSLDFLK